jgi:1-acyl-sn-glycerol-3-phosphate acyltransferase
MKERTLKGKLKEGWAGFKATSKRIVEVGSYRALESILPGFFEKRADIRLRGIETLPYETQNIFAITHTSIADAFVFGSRMREMDRRQIHYAVEYTGIWNSIQRPLHWALGSFAVEYIPEAELEKLPEEERKRVIGQMGRVNVRGFKRGRDYLSRTKDDVGFFVDGPTKYLVNGWEIIPVEKRTILPGAVRLSLSSENNIPVVPVALRTTEEATKRFFEVGQNRSFRRVLKDLDLFVEKNGKIPYVINIGLPISPSNYRGYKTKQEGITAMNDELRGSLINLYQDAGKYL